jgi:hypothetical protein
LAPYVADLRPLLKTSSEGRTWALDAFAAMGPLAKEILPDLEAWKSDANLNPDIAGRIDRAIAAIRGN